MVSGGPILVRVSSRALAALTCAVLAACSALNHSTRPHAATLADRTCPGGDAKQVVLFSEALTTIEHEYVTTPNRSQLLRSALEAMASSLDAYSGYLDPAELQESEASDEGTYCGIGLELDTVGSAVEITSVVDESPAARAGLRRGDAIISVDREPVGANAAQATRSLRGHAGTKVDLVVRRHSAALRPYTLLRECFRMRTVTAALLAPGYGYARISSFNDATPSELKNAVASLNRMSHSRLRGFVLDLRENGGGVLEDGAAVADAFLESGLIVTVEGRAPDTRLRFEATPGDLLDGAPMSVLVNRDSASASEIVAGALRDHGRATLIGSRTYGKGTVQSIIPLSGGAIELTTARWLTPSGASVQDIGIVPDVLVDDPARPSGSPTAAGYPSERDPAVRVALSVVRQHASPVDETAATSFEP